MDHAPTLRSYGVLSVATREGAASSVLSPAMHSVSSSGGVTFISGNFGIWRTPSWLTRSTFRNLGPICWFPMPGLGAPAETLLNTALRDLRCIEWSHVTAELLQLPGPGDGSEYHLSRPVQPDEVIDFFISHSWHDDAAEKYRRLQEVAEMFRKKCGRHPVFWLDKACIDQNRMDDCLKVLPINVMACSKVLVLVGNTYMHRLWCVWELFILFAFTPEEEALQRIVAMPLTKSEHLLQDLQSFDISRSYCYDPNEEFRLRHVIGVVGADVFNIKIRSLAAKVRELI
mmetsp:Transcript_20980/g.46209  ORF Transcript_20980/g.46209 Transcript_20980/m.46209 type:complete len:286 (+) Transcript_20980:2-859(+)